VITTSSAFLDVLLCKVSMCCTVYGVLMTFGGIVYIDDNPEEPGVRCLRIELSLSPAMVNRIDLYVGEKKR